MTVAENSHIVVEGEEDRRFLKRYLSALGVTVPDGCFDALNGWTNLGGHKPTIKQKQDQGIKVLIIFDANADQEKRIEQIRDVLGSITPPVFLFPDDKSAGGLEDLLLQIIVWEHSGILECFEHYKKCLNERDRDYTLPDTKGKVYAYKEAIGALLEKKENQFDSKYWNYDHPALNPLKKFLTEHIGK